MQMESVAPCRDREAGEGAEEPLRTSCSGSKCSSSRQFIQDQLQMQIG